MDRLVDEWTAAVRAGGAAGSDALAALGGFEAQHPFVRAVLGSDGAHGEAAVTVGAFQAGTTAAVDAVANTLKSQFRDRVDWAIFRLRLFLVLTFLFLQAIAFGLIGFAAHRDIRPAF